MFSTPETSVHVLDKNRETSPLERDEGYGVKDLEKRWVLRREWKTLWDTPTTDLGAESEPGDGGEQSEVANWQGMRMPFIQAYIVIMNVQSVPQVAHSLTVHYPWWCGPLSRVNAEACLAGWPNAWVCRV